MLGYSPKFRVEDGVTEIQRMLENGNVENYQADRYYNVRYLYK